MAGGEAPVEGQPAIDHRRQPCLMISMSVAQTAIASTRIKTSAAPGRGTGTGYSTSASSSGLRAQAFIAFGIGCSLMRSCFIEKSSGGYT
jgi:hypothetical protein